MDRRLRALLVCTTLILSACQRVPPREGVSVTIEVPDEDAWTAVASPTDFDKVGSVAAVWTEALAAANKAGFRRQIEAEGELLDPAATQSMPPPPPGFYHCRIIRFGAPATRQRAFTAYKPFFCYVGVNEDRLALTKDSGSERHGGYLWADADNKNRMIFLGAVALGREKAPPAYGDNPTRDVAGVFERVDDFRFRLVLPRPRSEARLDVMELVPALN